MKTYEIDSFLQAPTPDAWVNKALSNLPLLLVDHAHCEKKAAATAVGMIYRYCDCPLLLQKMSRLAREELRHFEQVLGILEGRGEQFHHLTPGSYAAQLHSFVTTHEPNKLVDSLILGAFIEARSCERFRVLADHLDTELATFYRKLYHAEARHFQEYLELAKYYGQGKIEHRIQFFGEIEAQLINNEDDIFRFHSGIPLS